MPEMMDPLEHLQMLKDSAAGIAPRQGDFTRIRALRFTEPGFDRAIWREAARPLTPSAFDVPC